MECVTTVKYSFIFNSNPIGYVSLQCGLCQGDLLSSNLFLLCIEENDRVCCMVCPYVMAHHQCPIFFQLMIVIYSHVLLMKNACTFIISFSYMNLRLVKRLICKKVVFHLVKMWWAIFNMHWLKS